MNGVTTVVIIGGFIILFSVVISILNETKFLSTFSNIFNFLGIQTEYVSGIITGLIEVTNGLKSISVIPNSIVSINIIICAFLLGFGGISVLLQVLSITSKNKISIKPYIIGKVLHGALASFYTFLMLKYFTFFNLDAVPTIYVNMYKPTVNYVYIVILGLVLITCICVKKILRT